MRKIIAEEEHHLEEMINALQQFSFAPRLSKFTLKIEEALFERWIHSVSKEISVYQVCVLSP